MESGECFDSRIKDTSINVNENMTNETEETYDDFEAKIEKEEIISKDDFYSMPFKTSTHTSIKITSLYYKKLGNTFTFLYNKLGDPLIVIGPHCNYHIYYIRAFLYLSFYNA